MNTYVVVGVYACTPAQHWLALEREGGDAQAIQRVFRLLPKKIKKRKTQKNANGVEEVTETLTYVFTDDEGSAAVRQKETNICCMHACMHA